MTPERKVPKDIFETPVDKPSGSWPSRVEERLVKVSDAIERIETALVGDFEKTGLIVRHDLMGKRIDALEKKNEEREDDRKDTARTVRAGVITTVIAAIATMIGAAVTWAKAHVP